MAMAIIVLIVICRLKMIVIITKVEERGVLPYKGVLSSSIIISPARLP